MSQMDICDALRLAVVCVALEKAKHSMTSQEALWNTVKSLWDYMSLWVLHKLLESMPLKCLLPLKKEGDIPNTKIQCVISVYIRGITILNHKINTALENLVLSYPLMNVVLMWLISLTLTLLTAEERVLCVVADELMPFTVEILQSSP